MCTTNARKTATQVKGFKGWLIQRQAFYAGAGYYKN